MRKPPSLRNSAQKVRKYGQGGDSVLAHISPAEAKYLQENFGGDINPHTGLPQYGWFSKVFKGIVKAPVSMVKNVIRHPKKILPAAGAIIGGMFGGPAGATAGGALGGALGGKKHMLDHALGGAAIGLGHSFLSPMLGKSLNVDPSSMLGKASMMNAPSWGEQLGRAGIGMGGFGGFGGSSAAAGSGAAATGAAGAGAAGASSGLGSMFGGNLLDTALLATGIAGTLAGKKKMPEPGSPENETMDQAIQRNKHDWGSREQYFPPVKKRPDPKFPPQGYRGTGWNFFPTPEEQEEQMRKVNEEMAQEGYATKYARGGKVKGYYKGAAGGQSDTRPANLAPDTFIMDATTVSLAGDGNSENGARQIKKEAEEKSRNFARSGFLRNPETSENVRALLSDGELEITPDEVRAFGGGSIKKGHKQLETFRKNIRKHKGVTKFLPPKSKPLHKYLGN